MDGWVGEWVDARINGRVLGYINSSYVSHGFILSRVQTFPAWHTKAAPNGKCREGCIVPSMVRLMYQLESVLK